MEQTARSAGKGALVQDIVREIAAAAKRLALYPPGHPACKKAAERPYGVLSELWKTDANVVIAIVDGKLVGDGVPLEERLLADGLGHVMLESGIQSITFSQGLTAEQFEKFISYLNVKAEDRDLIEFLKSNRIKKIAVDKWHYELVGEDEQIVSADIAEGQDGQSREFKQALTDLMRQQPELITSLLGGDSVSQETAGATNKLTVSSPMITTQDHDAILSNLESLNDNELLKLLAAALQESLEATPDRPGCTVSRALFSLKEFVEKKENPQLLTKLRQALERSDAIDQKYIDLILGDNLSPQAIAYRETESFRKSFLAGNPDPDAVSEFSEWLGLVEDKQYVSDFLKDLYRSLEQQDYQLSPEQGGAMLRLAQHTAENPGTNLGQQHLAEIIRRLASADITLREMEILADQIEPIYMALVEKNQDDDAVELLKLVNQKAAGKLVYAEGVATCAANLQQKFYSAQLTEELVARLAREFGNNSKPLIRLLEQFIGFEAASVFTSYIDHEERGVRVLMIRLLSQLHKYTITAFEVVLSDRSLLARPSSQVELALESWYKLRNLVLVLGNIDLLESIALLEPLSEDRDERIVLEVLAALEKLGGPEANRLMGRLLSHPSRQVQHKALRVLSQSGAEPAYLAVQDYFLRHPMERGASLPALIALDKERTITFLTSVLEGKSDLYRKYHAKADESLNKLIVHTFIQWRLQVTDDVLRWYVKNPSKSMLSYFRKPASVKAATKYLSDRSR